MLMSSTSPPNYRYGCVPYEGRHGLVASAIRCVGDDGRPIDVTWSPSDDDSSDQSSDQSSDDEDTGSLWSNESGASTRASPEAESEST